MRRLPGEVCCEARQAFSPSVEVSSTLLSQIERCLAGDLSIATVAKLRTSRDDPATSSCRQCAAPTTPVRTDLAVGDHGELIVEGLRGGWCPACGTTIIDDATTHLHRALDGFRGPVRGDAVPSLSFETPRHPRSVQFEISTQCNLACGYCSHRDLPIKAHATLGRFRERLARVDLLRVHNVDFTGLGEPLLNLALADMVREVRHRNADTHIRVVTNGTALVARRIEALCDAGLTSVAVSIDSLDAATFARARGGARLEMVLANLEALAAARRRRLPADLDVKIKSVLLDRVYEEADALLRYSARIGIGMPHFSRLDARTRARSRYREEWLQDRWEQGDDEFAAWAAARWRELGGECREPTLPLTPDHEIVHPLAAPPAGLCRWAVDAAFITIDGDCLSCCETMIDLPRRPFAHLHEQNLEELWTGPLLWAYRLPLALGLLPDGCVGCPHAPADGQPMEPCTDRDDETRMLTMVGATASPPPTRGEATARTMATHGIDDVETDPVVRQFGQLFLLAFDGPTLAQDVAEFLRTFNIGGVVLFADNYRSPDQLRALIADLQRRCARPELPLFVATDHEGGRVQRFRNGFTALPPMAALGSGQPMETAALVGRGSRELAAAGVNFNLAPVADLCAADRPGAIGDRAFGEEPARVAEHVRAAIGAIRGAGLLACVKHFPGHGDTDQDSHHELPTVKADRRQLEERDWKPFRAAMDAGVDAIMTAHVVYPAAGDAEWPASLSRHWQQRVLREELHFDGLIVSDALEMKALREQWTPVDCGARALEAGSDLLLYYREAYQYSAFYELRRALARGAFDRAAIAGSLARVARAKARIARRHHGTGA
jgi:beta-N-acetylhexosaminidase